MSQTTEAVTLTGFLLDRIAEDELAARRAASHVEWVRMCDWVAERSDPDVGLYVLDHQPERVLAECEAKRGLLTFVLEHGATVDGEYGCCHDADALLAGGRVAEFEGDEFDPLPVDCPGAKAALPGLLLLALPYAGHPGYREEWKP